MTGLWQRINKLQWLKWVIISLFVDAYTTVRSTSKSSQTHYACAGMEGLMGSCSQSICLIPQCFAASRSNVAVYTHLASLADNAVRQSAKSALPALKRRTAFQTIAAFSTIISLVRSNVSKTSQISTLDKS